MNFLELEGFAETAKKLYGSNVNLAREAKRYTDLYNTHKKDYSGEVVMFSSPGRIEICGNHTDHNNGKVLCAAITVDTLGCISKNDNGYITINSIGYPIVEVNTKHLDVRQSEKGTSEALVRGVCRYFADNGYEVGGFNATTVSDVFKGAGVSSSASFEVLVAEVINQLYNDGKADAMFKAKAAQYAENVFFGKPCGLLDQSAIALGGVSYLDFKSTKNPVVESMDWEFDCDIVLINAGGDHSDLTDAYASIRREMEQVAALYNKKNLRTLKKSTFFAELPYIKEKVSGRALLRAMHYYNENDRVEKCRKAVKGGKYKAFCKCINDSGESSYKLLQNLYPEGDTSQGIPLAINISGLLKGVDAVRVHGGGFAGTVIAYIDPQMTDDYVRPMSKFFGAENIFVVKVRNCGTTKLDIKGI